MSTYVSTPTKIRDIKFWFTFNMYGHKYNTPTDWTDILGYIKQLYMPRHLSENRLKNLKLLESFFT